MTPSDDDRRDMDIQRGATALSDGEMEALVAGRGVPGWSDLHGTIQMLRSATPPPAPPPSPALEAVLQAGFDRLPDTAAAPPARGTRWGARIAVATAAIMASTLGAAAANALPAPLQNAVATTVGALTPLELPRPAMQRTDVQPDVGSDKAPAAETDLPPTSIPTRDGDAIPEAHPSPNLAAAEGPTGVSGEPATPGAQPVLTPATEPVTTTPTSGQPDQRRDDADGRDQRDPEHDEPDSEERDADENDEPDVDEPDADEPELDVPDVDEPDADEPDADEPDADEPDTEPEEVDEVDEVDQADEVDQSDEENEEAGENDD